MHIDPSYDVAKKFNLLSDSEKLTVLFDMIYEMSVRVTYMSNTLCSSLKDTPSYIPELETE